MNVISILQRNFGENREAFEIVLKHSTMVAAKAVTIARSLSDPTINIDFVEEAALLHDIGICRIHAPRIACHGDAPYICHGILGRQILETEGLDFHALVCERHIGVGIGIKDIVQQQLPLPKRDMLPVTLEEKIICFADLFYSKKPGRLDAEKSVEEIKKALQKHGAHKVAIFENWVREFSATSHCGTRCQKH
ncbi:MAG: HDIG domain-containing protein [Deltaproteobacteria bacterium]|nr:HDIG domain-containing protein [Deltaproteobacteria bacterium]